MRFILDSVRSQTFMDPLVLSTGTTAWKRCHVDVFPFGLIFYVYICINLTKLGS